MIERLSFTSDLLSRIGDTRFSNGIEEDENSTPQTGEEEDFALDTYEPRQDNESEFSVYGPPKNFALPEVSKFIPFDDQIVMANFTDLDLETNIAIERFLSQPSKNAPSGLRNMLGNMAAAFESRQS